VQSLIDTSHCDIDYTTHKSVFGGAKSLKGDGLFLRTAADSIYSLQTRLFSLCIVLNFSKCSCLSVNREDVQHMSKRTSNLEKSFT